MTSSVVTILLTTVKVATSATLIIFVPGVAVAYLLARREFTGKTLLSTAVLAPLVLPPTAIGYLLLQLLAYDGPLGERVLGFDWGLLLDWKGAVLASAIMALPLVVRTARVAFESVDPRFEALAHTLGHGTIATWWRCTLPLARRGLLAAAILGFTRALGEFGATVTVAGNIPGRTQTLASAIWSAQQAGDERQGRFLLLVALCLGFAAVFLSERLARKAVRPRR